MYVYGYSWLLIWHERVWDVFKFYMLKFGGEDSKGAYEKTYENGTFYFITVV